MTQAYVKKTLKNKICYIEFFHPAHNSLPGAILLKLAKTITEAANDEATKVIVLQSGGNRTFCAGASFNELISIDDKKTGEVFFSGFAHVINAMRKCSKLIIGRIQGKAVGGGLGLASATDYCMATKFAAIKLSELNVGIGPFVVGPAVARKMGLSAMTQIAIDTNTFYSAEWAREKGLYTHVFETVEALDSAIHDFATNLCSYNEDAMKAMKKVFWEGTENWDQLLMDRAKISGELVLSDFTKKVLKKYQ